MPGAPRGTEKRQLHHGGRTGRQLGVDPGTLARWERGEREPAGALAARSERFLAETEVALSPGRFEAGVNPSQRCLAWNDLAPNSRGNIRRVSELTARDRSVASAA
jgi:transcriptional regulator with XRE-family HTH domain